MTKKPKTALLQSEEQDFQAECQIIIQRLDHYKTLLNTIAKAGKSSFPITVRGTDVHRPEYENDLNLLERCSVVKKQSQIHQTQRIPRIRTFRKRKP